MSIVTVRKPEVVYVWNQGEYVDVYVDGKSVSVINVAHLARNVGNDYSAIDPEAIRVEIDEDYVNNLRDYIGGE